jgi:S1-C subfamily serine protease
VRRLALAVALLCACASSAAAPVLPHVFDPVKVAVKRTVLVEVDCQDDSLDTGGTAVLYGGDLAVTAAHVVDEVDPLTCVVTLSNDWGRHVAVVVKKDTQLDLAILSSLTLSNAAVGISQATLGMDVWSVGYPSQLRQGEPWGQQALTVTRGVVASLLVEPNMHRVTSPVFYGNSGGGVWSATGGLVGIAVQIRFWRGQFIESQGRIVPVEVVMAFVADL